MIVSNAHRSERAADTVSDLRQQDRPRARVRDWGSDWGSDWDWGSDVGFAIDVTSLVRWSSSAQLGERHHRGAPHARIVVFERRGDAR